MTKFDRETLATTGFLKERGVKPVSFCDPAEVVMIGLADVVMLGPAEKQVVMVSLGPAAVVMIVKTLDMMFAESSQSLRRDNKVDDIDEPRHSGLIT